ncbi:hypothetical protein MKX01_016140 [Papaver californicum]|nr:hypothetical protein MKX01_016140 [Papaver californicum]
MGYKLPVHFSTSLICFVLFMNPLFVYSELQYPELYYNFYDDACPPLRNIVRYNVWQAVRKETRIAASLLRLHFHDCLVDGCDASILLEDTKTFKGEKNALPNKNSVRGYELIDSIKADVERECPLTVSCVDILALAASEAISLVGGPYWHVPLGRRDGITASQKSANEQLPSPFEPLANITAKFTSKGLDLKDVVVLSGAHTIGFAQCFTFKSRLFNFKGTDKPDPTVNSSLLQNLQSMCPEGETQRTNKLAPLDSVTYNRFDHMYYSNLMNNYGLLESDQALIKDPTTASMVNQYSMDRFRFYDDFAESMVKLGFVGILTGENGEIRAKCGSVN